MKIYRTTISICRCYFKHNVFHVYITLLEVRIAPPFFNALFNEGRVPFDNILRRVKYSYFGEQIAPPSIFASLFVNSHETITFHHFFILCLNHLDNDPPYIVAIFSINFVFIIFIDFNISRMPMAPPFPLPHCLVIMNLT